ncbi:Translation initiation factor IF-3, domain-containing protein [Cladophialophora immunda]|nr:Translation initiation factor IF-3, domain-containing protein [Cladophialophora immunda]
MRRSLLFARPLLRALAPVQRFQLASHRCFAATPGLTIDQRRVAGKIEIKTIDDKIAAFTLNEKIRSSKVQLKGPDGKLSEPQPLSKLLDSIDRATQYVLQMNKPAEGEMAIVQIVTRAELIQRINRQEDLLKNQKRLEKEKRPKQLELNWAISANDLQLKMKQMQEFLKKGKKVELLLANKRHQRKASQAEAEALLKAVREKIEEVGAAEVVPMEGAILRQALLTVKMRGS